MTTFTLNSDLFRIAHACASTEKTRYYLNGVHVENLKGGGVAMVATNGHHMLVVRDEAAEIGGASSYILQVAKGDIKQLKTSHDGRRARITRKMVVTIDGNTASARLMEGEQFCGAIPVSIVDGSFPDWRRVIPQPVCADSVEFPPAAQTFNAKYVEAFAAIGADFAAMSGDRDAYMTIALSRKGSPQLVRWGDAIPAFGVIMPIRDDLPATLPDWLNA